MGNRERVKPTKNATTYTKKADFPLKIIKVFGSSLRLRIVSAGNTCAIMELKALRSLSIFTNGIDSRVLKSSTLDKIGATPSASKNMWKKPWQPKETMNSLKFKMRKKKET